MQKYTLYGALMRCVAASFLMAAHISFPTAAQEQPQDQQDPLQQLAESLRGRVSSGGSVSRHHIADRMAHYGVPGVAIAILKDGKVAYAGGFGVLQAGTEVPVDENTLFSVGSVSKVATAALVLKQQAMGLLDVDLDVRDYLTSWQLGSSPDNVPVTLRMILSHTAGFNIHGFGDFLPGAALPSVYDTLNGAAPATNGPLRFLSAPGSRYRYSGGGYTLAQLVLTDTAQQTFPAIARQVLFTPLGMERSTFANPLPEDVGNVAKAHDRSGKPAALPRGYEAMPEMAASGLWTSAAELGRFVGALIESYRSEGGYLPQPIAADMMTKVSPSEHGLGPRLEGMGVARLFHHGGANNSYRAWIEGHLVTGDGLVVLTNGTRGDDLYVEIRNAAADVFGWGVNQPVVLAPVPVQPVMTAGYVGSYRAYANYPLAHREQMIGWIYDRPLHVVKQGETLYASIGESEHRYELLPTAPNRFIVSGLDQRVGVAELVFHRDADAKTEALTLELAGARSYYRKGEPDRLAE